jgi:hypothetical protein
MNSTKKLVGCHCVDRKGESSEEGLTERRIRRSNGPILFAEGDQGSVIGLWISRTGITCSEFRTNYRSAQVLESLTAP